MVVPLGRPRGGDVSGPLQKNLGNPTDERTSTHEPGRSTQHRRVFFFEIYSTAGSRKIHVTDYAAIHARLKPHPRHATGSHSSCPEPKTGSHIVRSAPFKTQRDTAGIGRRQGESPARP